MRVGLLLFSILVFPLVFGFLSPFIVLAAASVGVINIGLVVFIILFFSALFFGRLWCGYFCPFGALQEFTVFVFDKPPSRGLSAIKYFFGLVWFFVLVAAFLVAGGIKRFDLSYPGELFVGGLEPYIMYYFFVGGFVFLPLFLGRRAGCRCVCWIVPFLILGRRISNFFGLPRLMLFGDRSRCGHCLICKDACSMGLDIYSRVQGGSMENTECILCGRCVHVCPQRAIKYVFVSGRK